MRVTRRSVRTAAVATGAAAALLLPAAGAAFAAEAPAPGETAATAGDQSVFWRNVDLADGSLAKVYQDGPGRFSADVYAGGSLIDTLVSEGGKAAYGENNGLHVVLRPDGTVSSWPDKAPAPKPAPTKVVKLPDGHIATFFAGKDGRPYVTLSVPGGTSWTYDFHGTLVSQHR
ncbi:hypothetical protein [Streptomyces tanashiensis]|uniref:hypothetical protein n=1 Tax=Streptomyces tanashiensis TaxID=67367 RepID=UPI00167E1C5C|nr:hypothetical protein [Streptomyces tanashiensis]GGY30391.1 hypothetical protein GCM10010299_40790 [Streptomyces tanashiensis]